MTDRLRTTRRARQATFAQRHRDTLILGGILLLTFLVYVNTLRNDFVDFDDPENVIDNVSIRALNLANLRHWFTTPLQFMYTPLVYVSYAVDHQLGGSHAGMYHFTNLALHLGNVVLVYLFFQLLTRRAFVAHFVALAFAIHPMNVDGVAWIATRSNLLATFFSLAALLLYLRYLQVDKPWYLAPAALLFLVATLSKSVAVVLPVTLCLVDYFRGRKLGWRMLLDKIPFFAIAVVMGIVGLHYRIDTVNPHHYTVVDRIFLVCTTLTAYLGRLFLPVRLAFAHAYPAKSGGLLPWYVYLSPVVLAIVAGLLLWMRESRRLVTFGLGFFMVNVVLSQTVLLIDNYQSNRYVYLPYLGLFLILADLTERLLRAAQRLRMPGLEVAVVCTLVAFAVLFSFLSLARTAVWKNTITVMSDTIQKQPTIAFVHNSRGIARYKAGQYDGARQDFEKTIELDPDFILSYYYLGLLKYIAKDYTGALADYDTVINAYPRFAAAFNERGRTKLELNDTAGALADFSAAIQYDSYLVDAYYNRGVAKSRQNDTAGACVDWRKSQSLGHQQATQTIKDQCPGG